MSSIIKNHNLNVQTGDPYKISAKTNLGLSYEMNNSMSSKEDIEHVLEDKLSMLSRKIENAENKYSKIIEETNAMMESAKAEVSQIRDRAMQEGANEGYNAGMDKANEEVEQIKRDLDEQAETLKVNFEEEKRELLESVKNEIPNIINMALKQILNHEIKTNKEIIESIVLKGLGELSDEKDIRVILSEDDYKDFDKESFMSKINSDFEGRNLSITFDKKLDIGSCIIETNYGFLDASISNLAECISNIVSDSIN